ncbi:MAG: LysR family transcriptional regulator, partial [Steroidobacteraceae bacterium]
MLDEALLAAVAAVAREGSFERAARVLHITPSAVSQRVKLLEERLGAVLIVRGQPCTATEIGAPSPSLALRTRRPAAPVLTLGLGRPRVLARTTPSTTMTAPTRVTQPGRSGEIAEKGRRQSQPD